LSFRIDRFEMKSVISREQRAAIMPRLIEQMRPDENALDGASYPIVSLYYDTPDRDCYWEKVHGVPSRRKMRVRVYGGQDGRALPTVFVEIKHKCDGRGVKRRLRVSHDEAYSIAAGNAPAVALAPMDQRLVEEIHHLVKVRGFQPCVAMRYDRDAYLDCDPESDLRVTFDTGVAYRFHDLRPVADDREFDRYLLPENHSIMEVKATGALPYWLTHLVGEHRCILRGHSKYSSALEAGDAALHRQLGARPRRPLQELTAA
jgi:VTC domain